MNDDIDAAAAENFAIRNCTITFSLGIRFSADEYIWLARNGWNLEYAPQRFHAIIMRVRSQRGGKVTALVFRSGRVVMTGLRHPALGRYMAQKLAMQLGRTGDRRLADRISVRNLQVRNLVGSGSLCAEGGCVRIDMHRLCREWRQLWTEKRHEQQQQQQRQQHYVRNQFVDYDPSLFPALRSRLAGSTMSITMAETRGQQRRQQQQQQQLKATCLVFRTGKFIVTGPFARAEQLHLLMRILMNILPNYIIK